MVVPTYVHSKTSNTIMRCGRHRMAAIAVATAVIGGVVAVPGFAQSDSARLRDVRGTIASGRTSFGVVRIYDVTADAVSAGSAVLPPNLGFSTTHRPIIELMLRRSPTFRRQCLRISNTPSLTIVVQSFYPRSHERVRARTRVMATQDGGLHATVEIRPLDDQAELIAHEIEHVIEQLDGIDLRSRASLPTTGVHFADDGAFETRRAVRVGMAVAEEVRRAVG